MEELFRYLEDERNRPGSDPQFRSAAKLACRHEPDVRGFRLREGFNLGKTVTLLKAAGFWVPSEDQRLEPLHALVCAAWIYTALLDATAPPTGTWGPVHTLAYSVLTAVLSVEFHLIWNLDDEAQPSLYYTAKEIAARLDPDDDLTGDSKATEDLMGLLQEYLRFLEPCRPAP